MNASILILYCMYNASPPPPNLITPIPFSVIFFSKKRNHVIVKDVKQHKIESAHIPRFTNRKKWLLKWRISKYRGYTRQRCQTKGVIFESLSVVYIIINWPSFYLEILKGNTELKNFPFTQICSILSIVSNLKLLNNASLEGVG